MVRIQGYDMGYDIQGMRWVKDNIAAFGGDEVGFGDGCCVHTGEDGCEMVTWDLGFVGIFFCDEKL